MKKEKLIEKYLEHRADQAALAYVRHILIRDKHFEDFMYVEFEMHYHQDEGDELARTLISKGWFFDMDHARWIP
jgi:hypothetical protein